MGKNTINKKIQETLEKEAVSVKFSFRYFVALPVIILSAIVLWLMYILGYLQILF